MAREGIKWYLDGTDVVHIRQTDIGLSNIKLYGRELTSSNKNKPLDEKNDEVILYLCGHRDGYDNTPEGFMLTKEKFIELAIHFVKKYLTGISVPIKLDESDLKAISRFIYSLNEDDLVGKMENKAEVLRKWTIEFENILKTYKKDIAIFIEFYE